MKIIAITPDKKMDAVVPIVIEGLYDIGAEVIATDPGNSVRHVYTDESVIEHAKTADFIFVLWGKIRDNRPPKYYLLDKINRPDITAYIDGSEWTATGYPDSKERVAAPWAKNGTVNRQVYEAKLDSSRCRGEPWVNEVMLDYCRWYFKRECYPEDAARGIIPFNIGCQNSYLADDDYEKSTDIACSFGHLHTGLRWEVYHFCKRLQSEGYNVDFVNNVSFDEYKKRISQAHIGVDAWGAGNSSMRTWEIMGNKTCCLTQRTEILFPNKPTDGIHWIEYSDMKEFETKIYELLANKKRCVDIGNAGYDFTVKYHTGAPRVRYMLDIMKRDLNENIYRLK